MKNPVGRFLQFEYTNWRGEEHLYVIDPEERLQFFAPIDATVETWFLSGTVQMMDGHDREGHPRRSFELAKIRYLRHIQEK